jgi:glycosyltransferase involved in cell wall biosynthesis
MNTNRESAFSFVVPVLNGEAYIRRCLEHIRDEMEPDDEVIVVDNGSTDNTTAIVREFAEVRLLEYPGETISALRNRGAEAATNGTLAFIDSDCLVCTGWRKAALEVLSDPTTKVTGSIYHLPESPAWVEEAWYSFRRTTPSDTHLLLGGNLVVLRDVFNDVEGFDESLITDEDADICLRFMARGHRLREEPLVKVIHLGNAKTLGQFYRKRKWHSTSILDTMFSRRLDKPMVMTLLFTLASLVSVMSLLAMPFYDVPLITVIGPVLVVPLITVLYRFLQHRFFGFFFQLWLLFLIFYVARTVAIFEALLKKRSPGRELTDKDRGK